uniref:Pyruvate dehydrogenase E1 component subunit beta n=1 Tax=Panagrolaimus davidi TaxID=227884 RepID=A0A914PE92_9BILA
MTIRDAVKSALNEEMKRDKRVFVLSEQSDNGFKITKGVCKKYGNEGLGSAGNAIKAAFDGYHPICDFRTFKFFKQTIDQIMIAASKRNYFFKLMEENWIRVPIVLVVPSGFSDRVGVQKTRNFSKWYNRYPNLKVLAPYDCEDHKGLLKAAIRDKNPVIFLGNHRIYDSPFSITQKVLKKDFILPIGKAKIVKEGSDVTIVAYSYGVQLALEAHEQLKKENINAEVINLRSLRPFDFETISKSVKKTHRLVIFEYGYSFCGISSEICIKVVKTGTSDYLDAPVLRVPGDERFLFNESNTLPTAANVVETVRKSLQKNYGDERTFSTGDILRKIESRNFASWVSMLSFIISHPT